MWLWNNLLASLISIHMLAWTSECSNGNRNDVSSTESENVDTLESLNNDEAEIPNILEIQKWTNKQISICLTTDDEDSFIPLKSTLL